MDVQIRQSIKTLVKKPNSQTEFAKKLGVCQQRVSQWVINGYVPDKYVLKIRKLYGVKVLDLVSPEIAKIVKAAFEDETGG